MVFLFASVFTKMVDFKQVASTIDTATNNKKHLQSNSKRGSQKLVKLIKLVELHPTHTNV